MKRKVIIYLIAAMVCGTMFSSYKAGPGANGWDCTGAETGLGNPKGCTGGGCHAAAATPGIAVALELDSAGVPTTHYTAGLTYTLKLTGTNNTTSNLPQYGFQIGCIKGSSALTTPLPTGSWVTPTPTGTHVAAIQAQYFVVPMLEQTTPLAPTTGTGTTGTVYSKSFSWTAPAAGTGTVSMWAVLNAVNGNNNNDAGDLWNTTQLVINEWGSTNTGINLVDINTFALSVFPNPAQNNLNFSYTLNETSNVKIELFDLQGNLASTIVNEKQDAGNKSSRIQLPQNIHSGIYFVKVSVNNEGMLKKIMISR